MNEETKVELSKLAMQLTIELMKEKIGQELFRLQEDLQIPPQKRNILSIYGGIYDYLCEKLNVSKTV